MFGQGWYLFAIFWSAESILDEVQTVFSAIDEKLFFFFVESHYLWDEVHAVALDVVKQRHSIAVEGIVGVEHFGVSGGETVNE